MPRSQSADSASAKPWLAHTPQPDEPPPGEPEPGGPPIGDPPPEPDEEPHSKGVSTPFESAFLHAADCEPGPLRH
ncbi:hypothetical protein [Paraburkholderia adhaesiva]|uniref:hypothetical protein n=1 Tax=Paraburkholderia adhaesiva TaxID=2883244 RepID=UPI001F16CEF8|nr:hypothetical protein [Paraburkholderia adhaesiva]